MKNEHTGKYVNRYGRLTLNHRPFAIRLPQVLEELVKRIAEEQDCNMAHVVRQALAEKFFSMEILKAEQIDLLIQAELLNQKFLSRTAELMILDNLFDETF